MRWIRDSRLRGNDGKGAGMTARGVSSRFRGNDEAPGDLWRRGLRPSTALARRMDSCLRRNDGKGAGMTIMECERDDKEGRNGGQRAPAIRPRDGARCAPSPYSPGASSFPRKREPTGGADGHVIPAYAGITMREGMTVMECGRDDNEGPNGDQRVPAIRSGDGA